MEKRWRDFLALAQIGSMCFAAKSSAALRTVAQSSFPADSDGPIEPMTQSTIKLARGFAFASLALAKAFDPAFNLRPPMRSTRQMVDEHLQMNQLFLDQRLHNQSAKRFQRDFRFTISR
jgi:hypothetical protein